jgi:hypothetical protein
VLLESARQQWEEGSRRLGAEARDPVRHAQLCDLVEAVLAGLRRRVGQRFTLSELVAAHGSADDWVREIVRDSLPAKPRVGIRDAALVEDAAFAVYARGATDWEP